MDEAGSSGSTQKLPRISPSLRAAGYISPSGRTFLPPFRGFSAPSAILPWRQPSAEHEPLDVGREREVKMVLVGRIVVGGEDAVEDVSLGRSAHQFV